MMTASFQFFSFFFSQVISLPPSFRIVSKASVKVTKENRWKTNSQRIIKLEIKQFLPFDCSSSKITLMTSIDSLPNQHLSRNI